MSISVKVLFDAPQREIASVLHRQLDSCVSAAVVVGFMTVDGVGAVAQPMHVHPGKLRHLVVGAGNYKAFEACDGLIRAGVAPDAVRVHLGYTRRTRRKRGFVRYHPMLHSKVFLMEMGDGTSSALVGSHNLTSFAMNGLNGEAGILLEGTSSSAEFESIRAHVAEAARQAVVYDPSKKEAYAWWAEQYVDGFGARFKDRPRDASSQKTMVILAECSGSDVPRTGEVVYFEIPEAIDPITSLQTEVHLFLFETLPRTPAQALNELASAKRALKCQTRGVEDDRGGLELRADWQIRHRVKPVLRKADDPFRPSPQRGMQQIRVRVSEEPPGLFEYLFDTDRATWLPLLDQEELVPSVGSDERALALFDSGPSETWFRVNDLARVGEGDVLGALDRMAFLEMSPESGNYILMSLRRRPRPSGSETA